MPKLTSVIFKKHVIKISFCLFLISFYLQKGSVKLCQLTKSHDNSVNVFF